MKRTIYKSLLEWKVSPDRKPLILEGARQVGKTFILQEFGNREFLNTAYINCYNNPAVREIFAIDMDIDRILISLSAYTGIKITPDETLIFLDEIQEVPNALASLKYFCEEKRNYHIVAAGSLLGVANMRGESYPVGKVDILKMYPMTFIEFLDGMGEEELVSVLKRLDWDIVAALHTRLIERLRQYYFVGGMPEAVVSFKKYSDPLLVRKIQEAILWAYNQDFAKHAGNQTHLIRLVWDSVPQQLAKENKKFIFGAVRKGARAATFDQALMWLCEAGLTYKVNRVSAPKFPLKFYAERDAFKLFVLDVGLLGALTGTNPADMLIGNNVFVEFKGAFTENYVLQQVLTVNGTSAFYYSKDNSTLEIDFIIQKGNKIIPMEVKAGENVSSRSLHQFITVDHKSENLTGIRLSMLPYRNQAWLTNVPLYCLLPFLQSL